MTPALDPPLGLCPEHPTTPAWRTCGRCGRFLCAACTRPTVEGPRCAACLAHVPVKAVSLGGWLLLPIIPLVLAPLWVGQELVAFGTQLRMTGLPALAASGPWYLGVTWWLVTSVGRAGLALFILPRYLRKHRSVPRLMVIFLLSGFVLGAVDLVTGEARVAEQSVPASMLGMLIPLMWVGYFQFSDRVRRTFVR